jgi:hypothetical protein
MAGTIETARKLASRRRLRRETRYGYYKKLRDCASRGCWEEAVGVICCMDPQASRRPASSIKVEGWRDGKDYIAKKVKDMEMV